MFLFGKKKQNKIPTHLAIIMDGNARWAKSKNLPLSFGHKAGTENIKKIADSCIKLKIQYLTLYAFSSENWDRPKEEVDYLMKMLDEYLEKEINLLAQKDIKIIVSGRLDSRVSEKTRNKIQEIQKQTKDNSSLVLNIAFSYGSRQEIVDAIKKIVLEVEEGNVSFNQINEDLLSKNLYNANIPDPDLLIRTAGDFRVSNFLLWQIAYTELYFTKVFWPDFNHKNLVNAISDFNQRERRYGKR